jgi:Zn finger protein HypA/HybF involved in hydrogenase expression
MGNDIASYRTYTVNDWEETPLWCHFCGQCRLLGQRNSTEGKLLLKCPMCSPAKEDFVSHSYLTVLQGLKGYKPLLTRLTQWCDRYYRAVLSKDTVLCEDCGNKLSVQIGLPPQSALAWIQKTNSRTVNAICTFCNSTSTIGLEGLVLALPESRLFMQKHPRIRTLPEQIVEAEGRSAVVTRFESVTENAQLTVVSAHDTYEVFRIYGGSK